MTSPASGTHTRVQLRRDGHALIPHGTLQTYDPRSGIFTAAMDFQPFTEENYMFTPIGSDLERANGGYIDQNGLLWTLIR